MIDEKLYTLFKTFQETWPLERIKKMTLSEYNAVGNKDSFCYWIEARLSQWGSAWGGTSYKFGIYQYAQKPKDGDNRIQYDDHYAWYAKYGVSTSEEAFEHLRLVLVDIITAVQDGDLGRIDTIHDLGHTIKWKIAFHYQNLEAPILLPIFKREWLRLLVPELKNGRTSHFYEELMKRKPADMDIKSYEVTLCQQLKDDEDIEDEETVPEEVMTPAPNMADNRRLFRALRTKPFVLLAGISGTGKSRIVRKLAQASVPEQLQQQYDAPSVEKGFDRWQLHKPANFELVQVKPNWHNSLEVVGYKSNIGGEHYEYTPFVEFVSRAWQHQDVPFFLCLDEMNLAPVEQYFAEFLSAIESRSIENGEYETDPIIKPFRELGDQVCADMLAHLAGDNVELRKRFEYKGLTLPKNLFVLGTVNMDETTFSFSRKVLDRAMSIVMNEVDYEHFFLGATEQDVEEMSEAMVHYLIDRDIRGLNAVDNDSETVKDYLCRVNDVLDNTPFKLGYRAANEALLYVSAACTFEPPIGTAQALDEFTLMKILSRIEGDKRSIGTKLTELETVITDTYPQSHKKLKEMAETLTKKQFVSYWT